MSIIKGILEEELERLEKLSTFYKNKISEAPLSLISVKVRSRERYIYLAAADGKKLILDYVGKDVPELRNALNERTETKKRVSGKNCVR